MNWEPITPSQLCSGDYVRATRGTHVNEIVAQTCVIAVHSYRVDLDLGSGVPLYLNEGWTWEIRRPVVTPTPRPERVVAAEVLDRVRTTWPHPGDAVTANLAKIAAEYENTEGVS